MQAGHSCRRRAAFRLCSCIFARLTPLALGSQGGGKVGVGLFPANEKCEEVLNPDAREAGNPTRRLPQSWQ